GIRDRNVTGVQTCALPILIHLSCKIFFIITANTSAVINDKDKFFCFIHNVIFLIFGKNSANLELFCLIVYTTYFFLDWSLFLLKVIHGTHSFKLVYIIIILLHKTFYIYSIDHFIQI